MSNEKKVIGGPLDGAFMDWYEECICIKTENGRLAVYFRNHADDYVFIKSCRDEDYSKFEKSK